MPSYAQPNFFSKLKNWIEKFLLGVAKNGDTEISNIPAATANMTPTKTIQVLSPRNLGLRSLFVALCGAMTI
jgi:hypothetical protein